MGTGSFPGVKAAGAWRWPRTLIQCQGHERVELYLCSPFGPVWPATRWNLALLGPQDSHTDQFYSCCNALCRHICVIMLIGHDHLLSLCLRQYMNFRTPTYATYATCLSLSQDTLTVLGAVFRLFSSCYLISFLPFLRHSRLQCYFLEHVFWKLIIAWQILRLNSEQVAFRSVQQLGIKIYWFQRTKYSSFPAMELASCAAASGGQWTAL
jgi:hypothetical protein